MKKQGCLSPVFSILRHSFRQLLAAQYVEVQMLDALATVFSHVGDDAVAVCKTGSLSDLRDRREDGGDVCGGIIRDLVGRRDVGLGNDQNVDGRLGGDVVKCVDGLVLVHLVGGDGALDDFTKQAIVHDISPLCSSALARWWILCYNTSRVYHAETEMSTGGGKIGRNEVWICGRP